MIDLCKLFGVEEGEEFEFDKYKGSRYKVINGRLEFLTDKGWFNSAFEFNEAIGCEVIKLPKKKEFTDDELCILRNFNKEYKWLCKDKCGDLTLFVDKPIKGDDIWDTNNMCILDVQISFPNLFKCIQWEDEEPVFIDDYVERGGK